MKVLTNPIVLIISQYTGYIYPITLNLHNVICQLYLNKAGKKF